MMTRAQVRQWKRDSYAPIHVGHDVADSYLRLMDLYDRLFDTLTAAVAQQPDRTLRIRRSTIDNINPGTRLVEYEDMRSDEIIYRVTSKE